MGNCILSCCKNIKNMIEPSSENIELSDWNECNKETVKKYLYAQTQTDIVIEEKIQLVDGEAYI